MKFSEWSQISLEAKIGFAALWMLLCGLTPTEPGGTRQMKSKLTDEQLCGLIMHLRHERIHYLQCIQNEKLLQALLQLRNYRQAKHR